jgi:protein-disulfide isomerase
MRKRRLSLFVLCAIVVIAGLGAGWQLKKASNAKSSDETWYFGPSNARWVITEYADLECPYCKAYTPQLKRWVSEQENVKLAWHHFPLDSHGVAALSEARLVQCAGSIGGASAFWQAIDQVLLRTRSNGQGLAGELELHDISAEDLSRCARTKLDIHAAVDQQLAQAITRGIVATPTIEVTDSLTGHSIRLEGAVDNTTLLSVIDALAAQATMRKE